MLNDVWLSTAAFEVLEPMKKRKVSAVSDEIKDHGMIMGDRNGMRG